MRKFDYSFLSQGLLPAELINITASISELRALSKVRKTEYDAIFVKLESVAIIQSVKGSNAIEGIVTTDKRIEQIVNQSSAPLNHDEMEIAGYRDALNLIHQEKERLQFDEKTILNLHSILLQYTGISDAGRYKTQDNVIIETDRYGNRKVRFSPVSAAETDNYMKQLILAYAEARGDYSISPLLLIPCVILDFLCIHPFRDGNGRMSRLLSLLLMYHAEYDVGKYISFEEQINQTKGAYYQALQESSQNWHENKNNYMPFIKNFIGSLLRCYKELDKRFAVVHGQKVSKSKRIEAVFSDFLLPISKQEICDLLPDVSPSTIEAVLAKLLQNGEIKKIGTYKNAKYIKT